MTKENATGQNSHYILNILNLVGSFTQGIFDLINDLINKITILNIFLLRHYIERYRVYRAEPSLEIPPASYPKPSQMLELAKLVQSGKTY